MENIHTDSFHCMQGWFRWCIQCGLRGTCYLTACIACRVCCAGAFRCGPRGAYNLTACIACRVCSAGAVQCGLRGTCSLTALVACRVCSARASAAPLGSACDPEGDFILQAVAAGPHSAPRHGNHGHALPAAGPGPSPAANPHWAPSFPCEHYPNMGLVLRDYRQSACCNAMKDHSCCRAHR